MARCRSDEDWQRIWAVETANPTLSEDFILCSNMHTKPDDWTCTTGEGAMDAALWGTYLPQLSAVIAQTKVPGIGEVFGNALTSGTNQYWSDLSQQQQNDFRRYAAARRSCDSVGIGTILSRYCSGQDGPDYD